MSLDADELQLLTHSARKLAETADLFWLMLDTTSIPYEIRRELFVGWWMQTLQPQPDIGGLNQVLRRMLENE